MASPLATGLARAFRPKSRAVWSALRIETEQFGDGPVRVWQTPMYSFKSHNDRSQFAKLAIQTGSSNKMNRGRSYKKNLRHFFNNGFRSVGSLMTVVHRKFFIKNNSYHCFFT